MTKAISFFSSSPAPADAARRPRSWPDAEEQCHQASCMIMRAAPGSRTARASAPRAIVPRRSAAEGGGGTRVEVVEHPTKVLIVRGAFRNRIGCVRLEQAELGSELARTEAGALKALSRACPSLEHGHANLRDAAPLGTALSRQAGIGRAPHTPPRGGAPAPRRRLTWSTTMAARSGEAFTSTSLRRTCSNFGGRSRGSAR